MSDVNLTWVLPILQFFLKVVIFYIFLLYLLVSRFYWAKYFVLIVVEVIDQGFIFMSFITFLKSIN